MIFAAEFAEHLVPLWVSAGLVRFVFYQVYFSALFIILSHFTLLEMCVGRRFGLVNRELDMLAEEERAAHRCKYKSLKRTGGPELKLPKQPYF